MGAKRICLCGLFAALLCLCSWLQLPLGSYRLTLQTFGIFLMLVHDAIAAEPEEGNISRVLRYINLHLAEPLSLAEIAGETFLSKYYLCRMFHRETGMTVNQYIAHCRIAKARRALTETASTVSDISEQCGFNSISYFTQCFREMEGMTPSEYRRKSAKRIPGSPG